MKKSFSLSVLSLSFCILGISTVSDAQEIICETEIEILSSKLEKVSVDKIELHKNGTCSVFTFTQREEKTTATGATSFNPALVVYKFSDSLQLLKKAEEEVKPFKGKGENSKARQRGTVPSGKMEKVNIAKSAYPDFYQYYREDEEIYAAADYLMGGPLISYTLLKYEYDWISNSFPIVKKEEKKIKMEVPTYPDGTFFIHDKILTKQELGLISLVAGNKKYVDSLKIHHHYRQQNLLSYNLEGKIVKQHLVSFEFPSELRLHQFVDDQYEECKGIVYVYGAARKFGFSTIDTDPTQYKIIWLDKQGDLLFEHSFNYGSRGSLAEPFYAAAYQDQLFVLGKGLGNEPDYHLMIFNAHGLQSLVRIDPDLLYSQNVGGYKHSLHHAHNSHFEPQGFRVLENGDLIFYGEHRYTLKSARFDPDTNQQLAAEYQYRSFAFLHFNKEGDFIKNYVMPRGDISNLLKPATINFLTEKEEQLQFLLAEPRLGDQLLAEHQIFITSLGRGSICKNCEETPEAPIILRLNLQKEQIHDLRFPEEVVNLQGQPFYILNQNKSELLWVGKSTLSELPVKLYLKKIKL